MAFDIAHLINGVIPAHDREGIIAITEAKLKRLLAEQRARYLFLTDDFIEEFCSQITWIPEPVAHHPEYIGLCIHIDLESFVNPRLINNRLQNIHLRLIRLLEQLARKKIYGFPYFKCFRHYPVEHYFMMRLNLIGFHFFDLRFEPRNID